MKTHRETHAKKRAEAELAYQIDHAEIQKTLQIQRAQAEVERVQNLSENSSEVTGTNPEERFPMLRHVLFKGGSFDLGVAQAMAEMAAFAGTVALLNLVTRGAAAPIAGAIGLLFLVYQTNH